MASHRTPLALRSLQPYPLKSIYHLSIDPRSLAPATLKSKGTKAPPQTLKNMPRETSAWIFSNAKQFYSLAKIALEDDSLLEKNVMAIICNLTLCVELLLKSTDEGVKTSKHQRGGLLGNAEIFSNAWGHDLEKIFSNLAPEIRARISQSFKEITNQEINSLLSTCKHYFVHARYSHEPAALHTYNITAIQTLAEGLIKSIESWHKPQATAINT